MDIIYLIVWAAFLQGFILSLTYIFSKKRRNAANRLLGLFLLAVLLMALGSINPYETVGGYNFAEYFALPNVLLLTPVLFLNFVLEKLGIAHKYKLFLRINYIVAILICSITLINLYLFFFQSSSISQTFRFSTVYWFHFSISTYSFLIAASTMFVSWKEIRAYKVLVQNEFSDYDLLKVSWLFNLVYFLLPIVVLWGVALYRIVWITGLSSEFDLPIFGLLAVFLYYLSYRAYLHPSFFEKLPESTLKQPWERSGSNASHLKRKDEDGQLVEDLMSENKYYLDHDLTIGAFASEISISPRKISSIINQDFQKNFNEWVNDFRVTHAKELLEKDSENQYSIEGIGMRSGFKSRSAFYTAFKNKFGCSPGELRKSTRLAH